MAKPFLTYDAQIKKLTNDKRMKILNPMTRVYQNDTSFEDILALYQFDSSLRELVFIYLCQIECKMQQMLHA